MDSAYNFIDDYTADTQAIIDFSLLLSILDSILCLANFISHFAIF